MGESGGARGNNAFVAPTDFGSHSMLHQTLIPSSTLSSASPSPFLSASTNAGATAEEAPLASPPSHRGSSAMPSYAAYHHGSLDGRMEALKSSRRPEEAAEEAAPAASAPAPWGLPEREGFSVEDLLDLEEFCEANKDGDEAHEEPPPPVEAAAEQGKSNDDSHQSSVVTYELVQPPPPPPEIVDLPAHDAEELEWVSRIMDDSFSELPPLPKPPASMVASLAARPPQRRPEDGAYRALPFASDPLRNPTICALPTEAFVPVKAKRSKRSRSSVWSLSGAPPFSDSTSSSSTTTASSCSSSASFSPFFLDSPVFGTLDLPEDYHLLPPPPKKSKHSKHKPKKRGRKPKNLTLHLFSAAAAAASPSAPGDRRCSHCGVQKTPQWRAGPEGAKTLCNACGVRYKSGRLLPEYRPACSPTFVSAIHSNSHRKVLEMRRKKETGLIGAAAPAVASF